MTLSTERRNEIAWLELLWLAKNMPAKNLSVAKVHHDIKTWLKQAPDRHREICDDRLWDFCNDLLDAVFFRLRQDADRDPVAYRLTREHRTDVAYVVLLYYYLRDGLRIKHDMFREINDRHEKLGIKKTEGRHFIAIIAKEMLAIAAH